METPPSWRPGDSWVYQWKSGEQTGIRIVHMQAIRNLNQMRFYVVSADGADQYWTSDLHWAGTVRDSKVEVRMTPPEPWFVWPLEVGRRWTHRGQYEDQSGKRDVEDAFAVVGIETITVPAGQFRALKVVRESHGLYSDQYWYVPEVRSYAKWIGRRGEIEFEWQLESYRPAPRLIPDAPGASTSPPR
ncbi:MAG TPA: hypothetical protein VNN07_11725 [Candidatus Tectomicrobia bacterium]|nr:hypothetical protein [Candidatus Tectomicrobia bacterium]